MIEFFGSTPGVSAESDLLIDAPAAQATVPTFHLNDHSDQLWARLFRAGLPPMLRREEPAALSFHLANGGIGYDVRKLSADLLRHFRAADPIYEFSSRLDVQGKPESVVEAPAAR